MALRGARASTTVNRSETHLCHVVLIAMRGDAQMATTSTGQGSSSIRYAVDTRASQFTVQAFASGLISAIAHSPKIAIRDWTGTVQMSSATLDDIFLKVKVKAASLEVLDELPDSDRRELHRVMNKEVLESPRYPEITYDSTQIAAEKLKDDLY